MCLRLHNTMSWPKVAEKMLKFREATSFAVGLAPERKARQSLAMLVMFEAYTMKE